MVMQPQQPSQYQQPVYAPPPMQNRPGRFSMKQKKIFIGVGIALLLLILWMIMSSLLSSKGPTEVTLTSVSARNSEILRLITEFEPDLSTAKAKTFATQANILIASDDQQITTYTTTAYSSTFTPEQITKTGLVAVGQELTEKSTQNNFDEIFISTLQFEINLNKTLLEQLNTTSGSTFLQETVSTAIHNYDSLLN